MANPEKGSMLGRAASDAMLANEGAQYVEDQPGKPRLEATTEQVEDARREMENRAREEAVKNVNMSIQSPEDIRNHVNAIAEHAEKIKIFLESPAETAARLAKETRERSAAEEAGQVTKIANLENDDYVARRNRPSSAGASTQLGAELTGRAEDLRRPKYQYGNASMPTTAPPIEKPKGFFKKLLGN